MNIHEVAEAAGVSVATVSRVINHPEIVAEKTRERVLAVLKRTSYAANAEPRSRRARKKHAIALILPSLIEYPNVHAGVRAIAALRNCGVQLCLTGLRRGGRRAQHPRAGRAADRRRDPRHGQRGRGGGRQAARGGHPRGPHRRAALAGR